MNKRILHIVLIAVLLFIWGKIGSNLLSDNEDEELLEVIDSVPSSPKQKERTYALRIDLYSDPFKGIPVPRKEIVTAPSPIETNATPSESLNIDWARIKYKGLLTNHNRQAQVIVLEVDRESHLVGVGSDINGFLIESVEEDSVELTFGNERRTIIKH
ncbi:MAG: hypothetical protein RIF46_01395 [Cyclobacteriaceae bacterium]